MANPEEKSVKSTEKRPSQVSFNLLGDEENEASWTYTVGTLSDKILKLAEKYIKGEKQVTFVTDPKTGKTTAIVWVHKDSPDLTDSSLLNNTDSAINKSFVKYSKSFNSFIERYSEFEADNEENNNGKIKYPIVYPSDRKAPFRGVEISLERFFNDGMDADGTEYKARYGESRKCAVYLAAEFDRKRQDEVVAIKVTKRFVSRGSRDRLVAASNFRI